MHKLLCDFICLGQPQAYHSPVTFAIYYKLTRFSFHLVCKTVRSYNSKWNARENTKRRNTIVKSYEYIVSYCNYNNIFIEIYVFHLVISAPRPTKVCLVRLTQATVQKWLCVICVRELQTR